jgi:hypothetical protein
LGEDHGQQLTGVGEVTTATTPEKPKLVRALSALASPLVERQGHKREPCVESSHYPEVEGRWRA